MSLVAVLGSISSHGGTIIQVQTYRTLAEGKLVATMGAIHACPIEGHGSTPIIGNVDYAVLTEGKPTAKVGSVAGCGAVISQGAFRTLIGS